MLKQPKHFQSVVRLLTTREGYVEASARSLLTVSKRGAACT